MIQGSVAGDPCAASRRDSRGRLSPHEAIEAICNLVAAQS
jgi:hypothetical protein